MTSSFVIIVQEQEAQDGWHSWCCACFPRSITFRPVPQFSIPRMDSCQCKRWAMPPLGTTLHARANVRQSQDLWRSQTGDTAPESGRRLLKTWTWRTRKLMTSTSHWSRLSTLASVFRCSCQRPKSARSTHRFSWMTKMPQEETWLRRISTQIPTMLLETTRDLLVTSMLILTCTAIWLLLMAMIGTSYKLYCLVIGLIGYRLPSRTWLVILLESIVSIKRWLSPPRTKINNKYGTFSEESAIIYSMSNQLKKLALSLENSIPNQRMPKSQISLTLSTRSQICKIKSMMERFRLPISMRLTKDQRLNMTDFLNKKNKEKITWKNNQHQFHTFLRNMQRHMRNNRSHILSKISSHNIMKNWVIQLSSKYQVPDQKNKLHSN